jgi:pilin isopeptide linkage protein
MIKEKLRTEKESLDIRKKHSIRPGIGTAAALLLFCLFLLSVFPLPVQGAGQSAAVSIPVKQVFDVTGGTAPVDTFMYTLTADDASEPMPDGASGSSWTFSMTGNTSSDIVMSYSHAGIFSYKIQEIKGNRTGYSYDGNVYTIKIYIQNENDSILLKDVTVQDVSGNKKSDITFVNVYKTASESKTASSSVSSTSSVISAVCVTPAASSASGTSSSVSKVKTGDESNAACYVVLAAASFAVILLLLSKQDRRKNKQHK